MITNFDKLVTIDWAKLASQFSPPDNVQNKSLFICILMLLFCCCHAFLNSVCVLVENKDVMRNMRCSGSNESHPCYVNHPDFLDGRPDS